MLIGTWHLFCESEKVSRNTNSYQRIMKTGVPFFMFWTQVTEKKKKNLFITLTVIAKEC